MKIKRVRASRKVDIGVLGKAVYLYVAIVACMGHIYTSMNKLFYCKIPRLVRLFSFLTIQFWFIIRVCLSKTHHNRLNTNIVVKKKFFKRNCFFVFDIG